jgi:hypothetical protein
MTLEAGLVAGMAGFTKALAAANALGKTAGKVIDKLKRTDSSQLSKLRNRNAASAYAWTNSHPADWAAKPKTLTDFVQIYALLAQAERDALECYVVASNRDPVLMRYSGPSITRTQRRTYDSNGRVKADELVERIEGPRWEAQFAPVGRGSNRPQPNPSNSRRAALPASSGRTSSAARVGSAGRTAQPTLPVATRGSSSQAGRPTQRSLPK